MKRLSSVALLFVALAGCAADRSPLRTEGPVALGEAIQVDRLVIAPERVIEDSRCPINALCVHAGRVVLRTAVKDGSQRQTVDLVNGVPHPIADGRLTLTQVIPSRVADVEILPEEYRFVFEFERDP